LYPDTWVHEGGIASNHLLLRNGELFSIQVQTARQAPKVGMGGIFRDYLLIVGLIYWIFFSS